MTVLLTGLLGGLEAWVFWLILAGLFIIVEAMTFGLVSIWFTADSLAAMLAALAGFEFWIQVIVMLIISALLLFIFIRYRNRFRLTSPFKSQTNADRIIGDHAEVIQQIDPIRGTGQVKVRGQVWSAVTDEDLVVPEGRYVIVKEIRGVKLVVDPV